MSERRTPLGVRGLKCQYRRHRAQRMEDFKRFFAEVEPFFLTEIKAVAMDMNASDHKVIQEKLPGVLLVYDRYHMQA